MVRKFGKVNRTVLEMYGIDHKVEDVCCQHDVESKKMQIVIHQHKRLYRMVHLLRQCEQLVTELNKRQRQLAQVLPVYNTKDLYSEIENWVYFTLQSDKWITCGHLLTGRKLNRRAQKKLTMYRVRTINKV
jgi:hypothetical protein